MLHVQPCYSIIESILCLAVLKNVWESGVQLKVYHLRSMVWLFKLQLDIISLSFFMTVTLDYKALIMLLKQKGGDADKYINELCKRGLDTECCVFCKVVKVGYSCNC